MKKQNSQRTWLSLYSIVAVLYLIVGIAMLTFDWNFKLMDGLKLIITSIIFMCAIFSITIKRIEYDYSNPKLNIGFLFSVIGASNVPKTPFEILWIIGIILFISGLFLAKMKN